MKAPALGSNRGLDGEIAGSWRAFCLHGDAIGHFAYHAEKAEAFEALAKLVRDITKAAP